MINTLIDNIIIFAIIGIISPRLLMIVILVIALIKL